MTDTEPGRSKARRTPMPKDLGERIAHILSRGAVMSATVLTTALGGSVHGFMDLRQHVEAWLCDHPDCVTHNGDGWVWRLGAELRSTPVETASDASWKERYEAERGRRERSELTVTNQRRHIAQISEELETYASRDRALRAGTVAEVDQVDVITVIGQPIEVVATLDVDQSPLAPGWSEAPASPRRGSDYVGIIRQLGPEAATVSAIAAEAGVNPVSVYVWIKSHAHQVVTIEGSRPKRYAVRAASAA